MKLFNLIKANRISLLSLILVAVAAALGADSSFALAEVSVTTGTEVPTNDDHGLATQLQGHAATASHVTETDFEKEEIDDKIAVYRPFLTPLEYDIVKNAIQSNVESYHPIHYRSGSNPLEATLNAQVSRSDDGLTVKYSVTSGAENLTEYSCVYVPGVPGYNGTTIDGELALFVTKNEATGVTFQALNANTSTGIPASALASAKVIVGTTAGSESQMIVDPDNYQPVPKEVYLQKKLSNIVFTDEWLKQAKKVPFVEKDLRQNALWNFNRKNSRTHWLGVKAKIVVNVAENKLGKQNVYFEEGILRQIPMFYSYAGGKLDFADLNAISKLQFAKGSVNNTARAYAGKNFIERLLNMDMTVHRTFKYEMIDEAGMTIHKWRNNFGTLEFVHDPTLDDIGYEDFAVVIDIKNTVHYVKQDEKVVKVDLSEGAGETHEAQREVFSIIDCVCLKGYNAVLVGPADSLGLVSGLGSIAGFGSAVSSLPDSPTAGQIVYLTATASGFPAGSILYYDATASAWKEYDGIIAV